MTMWKRMAVAVVAGIGLAIPQAAAADPVTGNAENIRKLDIMLMVTSLRCRTGKDNFQADYRQFSAAHLPTLNKAGKHLRSNLAHRHGSRGAKRALDKISVGMANQYGQGHPWLGCAQLKQVTRELVADRDSGRLSQSATELLAAQPLGKWAAR